MELKEPRSGIKTIINNPNSITVEYGKSVSAHEAARKVIETGIAPITELEKLGVLKGVRIILFGGTVYKPQEPKDFDIVALYDEFQKPENIDKFSERAKDLLKKIYNIGEDKSQRVNLEIDVSDKTNWSERITPKYIELWLMSNNEFLSVIKEAPEDVRKRAFYKLSGLPEAITSPFISLDGMLYSTEAEENDRNTAILYILVLGKAFSHHFSSYEVSNMAGYPSQEKKFANIMDLKHLASTSEENEWVEIKKRTDKFIIENSQVLERVLSIDTVKNLRLFLEGKLEKDKLIMFASNLTNEYSSAISLHEERARTRWIYQGILTGTNPEMGTIDSGLLIYGANLERDNKPLFKEDYLFLKRKRK